MKYFGKKSWSSILSVILHIAWYVVLVLAIIAPLVICLVIFFSTPTGDSFISSASKGNLKIGGETITCQKSDTVGLVGKKGNDWNKDCKGWKNSNTEKDKQDWENFKNLPLFVKILILPYIEAVLILLLLIIKVSQKVFTNFKNDIIFNETNVLLISKAGKLNIAFSILTFSFSSLVLCVLLFMLCDIIKNGTALQQEHDLTV